MYDRLSGNIVERSVTEVVLQVAGVGYILAVPVSTSNALPPSGAATLFTHLYVREDQMRLFGFATRAERQLFRMLISVSGIGPSTALAALSGSSPGQFKRAIESDDSTYLSRIKGIGRKTAERIIIEVREPIKALEIEGAPTVSRHEQTFMDAVLALQSLGYTRGAAEKAVRKALAELKEPEATAENLVRAALRFA